MADATGKHDDFKSEVVGHLDLTPEQKQYLEKVTGLKTTKITITQTVKGSQKAIALGNAGW